MKEIWKDIKDYEGYYEVSSYGRVRSLDRMIIHSDGKNYPLKGRIMKISKGVNGYLICNLHKNSKGKSITVHRLVAEAFLPNPSNLSQVNHKDEVKDNNHVENLEWCDSKYNTNYGTCIQRRTEKLKILFSKPVLQIEKETNKIIAEYSSAIEAARQTGFSQGNISRCCRGERKTAHNYKWKYKKE